MEIHNTLTVLVATLCVATLTKGTEIIGRTRLGSFFQDSWMNQPYGSSPSSNRIVSPRFQRDPTAWDDAKKREFIKAILDGLTSLGHFVIFNLREDGTLALLDGQHRLTTVQNFIDGNIHLGKKGQTYSKLTDEQKATLHNVPVDVKIYYHLTEKEERDKYFQLNNSVPLSPDARLHAHCNEEMQPVFQWCHRIWKNVEENPKIAHVRQVLRVGDVTRQNAEKVILPVISLLISGKTNKAKKDHATLAGLPVPEDMNVRLDALAEAIAPLDSSHNTLSKFIGPIAYDLHANWANADEVMGVVARWSALILRCKTREGAWDEAVEGIDRVNNEVTDKLLKARCARIREMFDVDGEYIGVSA